VTHGRRGPSGNDCRNTPGDFARSTPSEYIAPEALYVHVPVCASKCTYCDFFSEPESSLPEGFENDLVEATLDRATQLAERFGATAFKTIYVGGGTPTMLPPRSLDRLLSGLASLAGSPLEWTVEANPDSLGPEVIEVILRRGVTRLSVGVQSLDVDDLEVLGRRHGPEAALSALRLASDAGLKVSADLIAGVPRSRRPRSSESSRRRDFDDERLSRFARELLDAGSRHLSVYDLTIEEGTPLALRKGALDFPSEDEDWAMRCRLEASLREAGLRRYEVSNYACIGDECLHNLAYWHMDSYIGAGPGAVSTIARADGTSLRIEEAKSIPDYRDLAGESAVETALGLRETLFEVIMMSFRTRFGLDLAAFQRRFGMDAEKLLEGTFVSWAARLGPGEPWPPNRSARNPDRAGLALDGKGLDILNRFLGDCLDEIDRKLAE
jgi:oxygen-independent coproporphyrinogen-3 oxidase